MTNGSVELTEEYYTLANNLNKTQRAFVFEYIKPKTTQRQAYLVAGGTAKTEESQDQSASRMFNNVKVRALYDYLLSNTAKNSILTRSEGLEILTKNARVKMTDVATFGLVEVGVDSDGGPVMQTVWTMKDSKDIDETVLSCIKSVTMTKQGPKIELHDQQAAIMSVSKIEGWEAPKKTELTGANGQPLSINSEVSAPEIAAALTGLMGKL